METVDLSEVLLFFIKKCLGLAVKSVVFNLVNVYMPWDRRNFLSIIEFQNVLDEFENNLNSVEGNKIVFVGDFNANSVVENRRWETLLNFTDENSFVFHDLVLPMESFTYLSPSYNSTSWLDHILISIDASLFAT